MKLQEAIDIAHDIREHFPHIQPLLVETDKPYRDGSPDLVIGLWRLRPEGGWRTEDEMAYSHTISSTYDYSEFLCLRQLFSPLPIQASRYGFYDKAYLW